MKQLKKWILVLLAVALAVLPSCKTGNSGKSDDTTTGNGEVVIPENAVDITAYTMIRSSAASKKLIESIVAFNSALNEKANEQINMELDFLPKEEDVCEILIGNTIRNQSKEVMNGLSGYQYRITKNGNKIIIAGTCDAMVDAALDWVLENCVKNAVGKNVPFPDDYTYTAENVVTLSGKDSHLSAYAKDSSMVETVQTSLKKIDSGATVKAVSNAAGKTNVIVVGDDGSDAYRNQLANLSWGEYSLFVEGGRAYVCAKLDDGMTRAIEDLGELFKMWKNSDGTLGIPADYHKNYVFDEALSTIPCAENDQYATAGETGDGCYQVVLNAQTKAMFEAYTAKFPANGFAEYAHSTIETNQFFTYRKDDVCVSLGFLPSAKQIRVIAETVSGEDRAAGLTASENLYNANVCSTLLTQLGTDYDVGQDSIGTCYIYRLADGSFIVIDGSVSTNKQAEKIYNVLKKQSPSENITIAAWIFTHAHIDHVGAFFDFAAKYSKEVKVENFIYHFPTEWQANIDGSCASLQRQTLDAMKKFSGAKRIIAHAGQEYYIRDAKVTMLFAIDIFEPQRLTNYNVSSLVFTVEAGGTKFLMTGDHALEGDSTISDAGWLMKLYSATTLKSDFVSVVHHGLGGGGTVEFYQRVQATYVLWPSGQYNIDRHGLISNSRNAYFKTKGTIYLADDNVDVFTLGSTVTNAHYDTVAAYLAAQ